MRHFIQRQLLYHPERATIQEQLAMARHVQLEPWLASTGELWGWLSSGDLPGSYWVILHGNAGTALDRVQFARLIQSQQPCAAVYLLEYPGYGAREGTPSEQSLKEAASNALQAIPEDRPLFLIGESLGSYVASILSSVFPKRVAGMMLITPFNNLAEVAAYHYPWFPLHWLITDPFATDQHVDDYPGPVAFILAEQDEVIPLALGDKLVQVYNGRKRVWRIAGARHNNVLDRGDWWPEAMRYLMGSSESER
jgi:uncharacterized protein